VKKSQAIRKILKKLKEWEGSRLEYQTAKEIMDVIENEIGMRGPGGVIVSLTRGDGWDPETKGRKK
jgi:hypothetical protein